VTPPGSDRGTSPRPKRRSDVHRLRPLAVGAGLAADRLWGEPPDPWHPVAWFGSALGAVEQRVYRPDRRAGATYAAAGVALGLVAGKAVRSTTAATTVAVAGRGLAAAATSIGDALAAGDLELARVRLPALVGRDPASLDDAEIARAVVESVAENTVDAIIAPAFWALVGGAPGVLVHRAVNTMDAMVGHRNERYADFGTAAARLDDIAAWVPARVTALLVMAARPAVAGEVRRLVRRDAGAHPSPNAGVAESAFAAALGVQLGGTNRYGDRIETRPTLGDGRAVVVGDIAHAVRLSRDCTLVLGATLGLLGIVQEGNRRRNQGYGRRR
jgi:adenosylcobinamide-phosphate synthase